MIRGRNFTDRVTAYNGVEVVDAYGKKTTTYTLIGTFPAAVEVLDGTKALYYQERGIKYPVIIEMRAITGIISKLVWNNKTIYPNSNINSKEGKGAEERDRGKFITITGSFAV